MTTRHAFVDESTKHSYNVCAVLVEPTAQHVVRRTLQELRMKGQRRIHMAHESPSRRRKILSTVTGLELEAVVYSADLDGRSQRVGRDNCLRVLVPDLLVRRVGRLVIESCGQDRQDIQVISDSLAKEHAHDQMLYHHERPASEALLWLPDIIGWAYGRGGEWYRRVRPVIAEVHKIAA